ncbi:MAG: hypothetical protein JSW27_22100 [Phycisphaerales bacterium]|nr:MAG: hypothetical protein JSW27_22100 [Phycisphaerales bacterium]
MGDPGEEAGATIALGIFGFLFVTALVVIVTPYVLAAAAIQKGPFTAIAVRKYKKSINIFENIWNSGGMSHRRNRD